MRFKNVPPFAAGDMVYMKGLEIDGPMYVVKCSHCTCETCRESGELVWQLTIDDKAKWWGTWDAEMFYKADTEQVSP